MTLRCQKLTVISLLLSLLVASSSYGGKGDEESADKKAAETIEQELEACKKVLDELGNAHVECGETKKKDALALRQQKIQDQKSGFCSGRRSFKKFCSEFKESFSSDTIITAAGAIIAHKCMTYAMGEDSVKGLGSFTLGNAISGLTTATLKGALTAWKQCKSTPFDSLKLIYEESVKSSVELMPKVPEGIREKIEELDKQVTNKIKEHMNSRQYSQNEDSIVEFIEKKLTLRELVYLPLSATTKDVSQTSSSLTPEDRERIKKELEALAADYPENKDALRVFMDQVRNNSSSALSNAKRPQAMLFGDAGTGKTTFAERLSNTLGLYLCEISVADLKAKDLIGDPAGIPQNDWDKSFDPGKAVGKLGDCFRRAGHSNFILLLDEIGDLIGEDPDEGKQKDSDQLKELKALLKVLTDPKNKQVRLGVGVEVPFSRVTIIGTSNKPLQNQALLERWREIHFKGLFPEQKARALHAGYRDAFATIKPQVSSKELEEIKGITDQYLGFIFEEDRKAFAGGRVVKEVVDEFVTYVKGQVLDKESKTMEERKKFIHEAFARRKPRPKQ